MYKVVFVNDLLVGGAGKAILELSEVLAEYGLEVHIIIYEDTVEFDIPKNIFLHRLQSADIKKKTNIAKFLKKKINELGNIDLIVSNSSPSNKILSLLKSPNIYHRIHSAEIKEFPKTIIGNFKTILRKLKYRKLYSGKKLILVSKGLENIIKKEIGASPQSIDVIYNTFNFKKIRNAAEEYSSNILKEKYIIHVGRLDMDSKRHDILLQAYKKANITHKLVILGSGDDENKIRTIIGNLQLEKKVILTGFTNNPYPWIKHADLLLLTSDFEGLPTVLIEALGLKTPVVSTNCSTGPNEILTNELAEYLVPVGDIDEISNKIVQALSYYPEITEAKLEKFRSNHIVSQYVEIIKRGKR